MDYEVKIIDSGRGGTIYYLKNEKELPFGRELATNSARLFVPIPPRWNQFCVENDLPQAPNRRGEILERVCKEFVGQKTSGAEFVIGDEHISISFGQTHHLYLRI